MISVIEATGWTVHAAGSYHLQLLPRCVVRLDVCSHDEVTLNGVDEDGVVRPLKVGKAFSFHNHLIGFVTLELTSSKDMSLRAVISDGSEFVDPRPMVVSEARPVDPVRVAIGEELRKYLADREMTKEWSESEVDEFIDDFVKGDLEFEDEDAPDRFGLPSAYEMEEERIQADRVRVAEAAAQKAATRAASALESPASPPAAAKPPDPKGASEAEKEAPAPPAAK